MMLIKISAADAGIEDELGITVTAASVLPNTATLVGNSV